MKAVAGVMSDNAEGKHTEVKDDDDEVVTTTDAAEGGDDINEEEDYKTLENIVEAEGGPVTEKEVMTMKS